MMVGDLLFVLADLPIKLVHHGINRCIHVLIDCMCIEGVAAEGWIRGGLPSRELTRDQDYLERQTHSQ